MSDASGLPTLHIDGSRAAIRLHRPEKRNRIEPADLTELIGLCDQLAESKSVRVVTVEAEGPVWCSGYHLGALADGERPAHGFGDACDAIADLPMPTIAVLAGGVHGGGTDLAMSCDFRVAADDIVLVMPAAKIGLQYYASGLARFVQRIGPAATKRLFLTAERVPADELLRIGYLTDVRPGPELTGRVDELVASVSELAPMAVRRTKAAIDQLAGYTPDLDAAQASHVESVKSDEHREAMAALKERRSPRFREI
ncbi:MAG: enoyl-CoA hydratase/isomerase family protein [Actinomycetota bacterium]|jgi:enoyl-CoA hydratase|nr:enoyl-CoA hydratase/isomerase family protein [Actinomycetota bacterium]